MWKLVRFLVRQESIVKNIFNSVCSFLLFKICFSVLTDNDNHKYWKRQFQSRRSTLLLYGMLILTHTSTCIRVINEKGKVYKIISIPWRDEYVFFFLNLSSKIWNKAITFSRFRIIGLKRNLISKTILPKSFSNFKIPQD